MNQHRDGFQRVRYREVTTRINESGTEIEEARQWKSKKVISELLLLKPGGHVLSP
jgi:hypothetical protein